MTIEFRRCLRAIEYVDEGSEHLNSQFNFDEDCFSVENFLDIQHIK